jgi:hypothetical protein
MTVEVKKNFTLNTLIPDIKKNFEKEATGIKAEIVSTIQSGKSPVAGAEPWQDYSDGYSKKKGKKRPVDMTVTGKMLRSIKSFVTSKGNVSIFFSSPIAKYHDLPGLARVLRQLLPKGNQIFIKKIQNKIQRGYDRAAKKAADKQNR